MSNPLVNYTKAGFYRFDTPPDSGGAGYGQMIVVNGSAGDTPAQLIFGFGTSNGLWFRTKKSTGWNELVSVATATPPTEYDLPLADGVTNPTGFASTYSKDQFGIVRIQINSASGSFSGTGDIQICSLPAGFKPARGMYFPGVLIASGSSGAYACRFSVTASGNVYLNVGGNTGIYASGIIAFPAV